MKTTHYTIWGKRTLDLFVACTGLIVVSPLFALLAVLIKVTSKGPVFYRQERVGRSGKLFRIAKFRSMYLHADRSGLLVTSAGDPRVTPVGRILRRLKLDELPQLWNVLKGEMSLVGPRPEVPCYVKSYSTSQRQVLTVRPGITDPVSILYRHEEKTLGEQADPERYYREVVMPDKLNLNLEYLNHISLSYDLSVLLRTTGCLFLPKWRLTRS